MKRLSLIHLDCQDGGSGQDCWVYPNINALCAVPVTSLKGRLSIFEKFPDWSTAVRTSPTLWSQADGCTVEVALREALPNPEEQPFEKGACEVNSSSMLLSYALRLGPKNLSPLKWIRWSGTSASQTSVSQAILGACFLNSDISGNALT